MAYNRIWLAAGNKGFRNRTPGDKMSSQEPVGSDIPKVESFAFGKTNEQYYCRDQSGEIFRHHRFQAIFRQIAGNEDSQDDGTAHAKVGDPIHLYRSVLRPSFQGTPFENGLEYTEMRENEKLPCSTMRYRSSHDKL
ncbi:hypothetical protein CSKR_107533 [Clonorchis sinensis]|uniref:Uncharacterized protein n=2 Tax=Clonorchis sinensis TaxID=79923 RepID=G7YP67_CLOSI|nr:hypothetical protein CSKR_107533 [Clonorchis sinensis]GAA54748.1 hypothetical protein CLF_105280 [Clonorchis sinensis]